jgi:hypothetical protein
MGLKSKSLLPFVQKPECKHSFGCLEHFIRKFSYNTGLYVIAKYLYELISPKEWTVGELITSHVPRDLKLSDTRLKAMSIAAQAMLILGISLYGVSRCLSSAKQIPKTEPAKPAESNE